LKAVVVVGVYYGRKGVTKGVVERLLRNSMVLFFARTF
jgi:hypothetical protein